MKRTLVALAVVIALAALFVAARTLPLGAWVKALQSWMRELGPAGYAVYVVTYVVFCVFFLPASPLTFAAGAMFGFVKGSIVVVIAATLGATASFLLGRTILRRRVESMTEGNAKFRALDRAIAREGGRIVFLVRLSPIFPFAYINFAFGLTGIRLVPYIVATFIGVIPITMVYVYIAATAASAAASDMSTTRLVLNIAGGIAAIAVTAYVTRLATRAIRNAGVD